jgi:hypothetical protein
VGVFVAHQEEKIKQGFNEKMRAAYLTYKAHREEILR